MQEEPSPGTMVRAIRATVELSIGDEATAAEALTYIEDALAAFAGGLPADDTMAGRRLIRVCGVKLVSRSVRSLRGPATTSQGAALR